ncbi:MAG: hypothetical protein ACC661_09250, partial [Verrucomicrobiales bacterium]
MNSEPPASGSSDSHSASDEGTTPPRRRDRRRMLLLGGSILLGLLVFLGIGTFFARGWLIERAQAVVLSFAADKGIYVSYDRLGYSPRRGLTFKDLTIYRDESKSSSLVRISDLGVKLGAPGSAPGTLALLSLKHSDILINSGTAEHVIESVDAEIELGTTGLQMERLEGAITDFAFVIDGPIVWASDASAEPETEEPQEGSETGEKLDLSALDLSPLDS